MKSVFSCVMLAAVLGVTAGMLNETVAAVGDRLSISRTEVNVRSGPSLQDSIIMAINPGEVIIEIDKSGDWYLVEFPNRDRRGWIYGPLLDEPSTPKVDIIDKPAVSDAEPNGQNVVSKTRTVSRTGVNVRSGPTLQDSIIMAINPGEAIVEIEKSGEWYLVDIPNRGRQGWIYGPLLDEPSASDVLTAQSAPSLRNTTEQEPTIPKRILPSPSQTPLQRATAGREITTARSERSWFDGDPTNGEKVFYKCGACHATARGVNTIGPSLWGVVGSKPAQAPGFGYSAGMRKFAAEGAVWDETTLDEFIRRPPRLVRGTSMPFSGIRDAKDRRDLIAYLRKLGV